MTWRMRMAWRDSKSNQRGDIKSGQLRDKPFEMWVTCSDVKLLLCAAKIIRALQCRVRRFYDAIHSRWKCGWRTTVPTSLRTECQCSLAAAAWHCGPIVGIDDVSLGRSINQSIDQSIDDVSSMSFSSIFHRASVRRATVLCRLSMCRDKLVRRTLPTSVDGHLRIIILMLYS